MSKKINSYSIAEIAKVLGVNPQTLRRWEKKGVIRPRRTLGNQRRYSENDLKLLRRHQTKQSPYPLRNSITTAPIANVTFKKLNGKTLKPGLDGYYSISDVANKLGVTTQAVRRLEKTSGYQPKRSLGNQRRYNDEDIKALEKKFEKKASGNKAVEPSLLTEKELANKMGVSLPTVSRWEQSGKLAAAGYRDGRALYNKEHINKATVQPTPKPNPPIPVNLSRVEPTNLDIEKPETDKLIAKPATKIPQKILFGVFGAGVIVLLLAILFGRLIDVTPLPERSSEARSLNDEGFDSVGDSVDLTSPQLTDIGYFLGGKITVGIDTGSISSLDQGGDLNLHEGIVSAQGAEINGDLVLSGSLYFEPNNPPKSPLVGTMYMDEATGVLSYFNGSEWVDLDTNISGFSLQQAYDEGGSITTEENDLEVVLADTVGTDADYVISLLGDTSSLELTGTVGESLLSIDPNTGVPVQIFQPTTITGNLRAPKLIDTDAEGYYLDPADTTTSLVTAGNIESNGGITVGGTAYYFNQSGNLRAHDGWFESNLEVHGTFNADGSLELGDGDEGVNIDSSIWDITSAGVASGLTGLTSSGSITFTSLDCSSYSNGGALTANSSGLISCSNDDGGGSGTSSWQESGGAISPNNSTWDVLIGSTATESAKFAFKNVNSGTPTASVSAGVAGAIYLTADGTLATTALQDLTLGTSATQNVIINPNGYVGIGVLNPNQSLEVVGGNGNIVTTNSAGAINVSDDGGTGGTIDFANNTAAIGVSSDGVSGGYDYDGTFVFKQKASNPAGNVEFLFIEEAGDWRFALPSSGAGVGTYNPRSMIIAGPSPNDGTAVQAATWGFSLAMDTSTYGADLGVQNNLQVLNESWLMGNVGINDATTEHKLDVDGFYAGNALVSLNETGGNDILTASASGDTKFRITNGGDVGIGSVSPLYSLQIGDGTDISESILVHAGGATGRTASVLFKSTNQTTDLYTKGAVIWEDDGSSNARGKLHLAVDTVDDANNVGLSDVKLSIDTSGNVGIGDTAPDSPLEILSTTNPQLRISYTDGSADATFGVDGSGNLTITPTGNFSVNTDDIYVDSTIGTGIGTSSLDGQLHVEADYSDHSAAVIDQLYSGDILAASASGTTKFRMRNNGELFIATQGSAPETCDSGAEGNIYTDSGTNNIYYCDGSSWVDLTSGAASSAWSSLNDPTGDLTLAHAEYETTFNFNLATNAAFDGVTMAITNDLGTDSNTQRLMLLQNADDALSSGTLENLLLLDNADANEAVTTGLSISDSGGGGFTTDISLQNSETIANATDDVIAFSGGGGADNTDLYVNLDGLYPIMYSNTDTAVGIDDHLDVTGVATFGDGSGLDVDETLIAERSFTITSGQSAYQIHAGGNITEATSGTHNIIATVGIDAISVIDGGGSEGVSNLASFYIAGAPTAGTTPVNGPYAMFVDAGNARFDGDVLAFTGVKIGADSTDNLIDDASNGGASTTLYIGNESINTTASDERLKEAIQDSEVAALDVIDNFRVVDFDWHEDNPRRESGRMTGLIAQEVSQWLPQVVKKPDDPNNVWAVEYHHIVPYLIKGMQEMASEIRTLASDVVEEVLWQLEGRPLRSPLVETPRLATDIISPLSDRDIIIDLNQDDESGTLKVLGDVEVSGDITAENASVSGVLMADKIESNRLNLIDTNIASQSSRIAYLEEINKSRAEEANNVDGGALPEPTLIDKETIKVADETQLLLNDVVAQYASISAVLAAGGFDYNSASPSGDLASLYLEGLTSNSFHSRSGMISELLTVSGQALINNLLVTDTLVVRNNMLFTDSSISTLSNTLYLQPAGGSINLAASTLVVRDNGTVDINANLSIAGDLDVQGAIAIKPDGGSAFAPLLAANNDLDLELQLASDSALVVKTEYDDPVAQISASGSARFKDLSLSAKSSGTTVILGGEKTVLVRADEVTETSKVFVTFEGDYEPATKYWITKNTEAGEFTIHLDYATSSDTKVSWILIN